MIAIENGTARDSLKPRARPNRRRVLAGFAAAATFFLALPQPALADTAAELEAKGREALGQLYATQGKTKEVGAKARGILIFPKIVKAGLVIGGQSGDGVLLIDDKPAGYYNISSGSFGLQAGVQAYGYVMFLMSDKSLANVQDGERWDIGSAPSVVVIDEGGAKNLNTLTLKKEVYAFPFSQKGLMGGLGLEGTVISAIHPKE